MTFPLENRRRAWAQLRPLIFALGLESDASVLDALLVDSRRPFESPDTWEHEWSVQWSRVKEEVVSRLSSGMVPQAQVEEWKAWKEKDLADRLERSATKLFATPRGLVYQMPFLVAAWPVRPAMQELLESAPSIRAAVGPDFATVIEKPADKEKLMRALARATAHVVEVVYKPQLRILRQVLAWLTGSNSVAKDTATCGQLMAECRQLMKNPNAAPVADFLDWQALELRNAVQHPETLRFDPRTSELVTTIKGTEVRWTEGDLRRRLAGVFERCQIMSLAIAHAGTGFKNPPPPCPAAP